MSYEIAWEPRGVVLYYTGQISCDEILAANKAYQSDFRFDQLRFLIADYSKITGCVSRPTDIEDVWALDVGAKLSNARIKKVVVTTSPEVTAMALHYKNVLGEIFPVEIFATHDEARLWINSSPPSPSDFAPL